MDSIRRSLDNFIRTDTFRDGSRCACFSINARSKQKEVSARLGEVHGGVAVICMRGSLEIRINGHGMVMGPRNIVTFLSGEEFAAEHAAKDFCGYVIMISQDYIINVDAHVSATYFIHSRTEPMLMLPVDDAMLLETMCARLESVTRHPQRPYFRQIIQCVVMIVLYTLCGIYESVPRKEHHGYFRQEELFTEFLRLVEENCRSQRRLCFYAERLSVTPKHLSWAVGHISGHSATEWIDYIVIQNIKRTLRDSSMTVRQVADYYAFTDSSFFGKYFKKHTGTTPRRFKTADGR